MGLKLCTDPTNETQECFEEYPLELTQGGFKVPVDGNGIYEYQVKLPEGVTCEHGIIQWNYRAGTIYIKNTNSNNFDFVRNVF